MKVVERPIELKTGCVAVLRSVAVRDAVVLLEHFKRVFKEHYRNFNRGPEYFDAVTKEAEEKKVFEFEEGVHNLMLAAFIHNKIVGVVSITPLGAPFQKYSARLGMGIETEFQNSGLGSSMLGYALEAARNSGLHSIDLSVRTFNQPAIALYEKFGFRRVGELKEIAFIDGKFFDEFVYQKIL